MDTPSEFPALPIKSLAIIGSGPSCVFLLKNLSEFPPSRIPRRITIFEKSGAPGAGMPYREDTTDPHHLSNISSEEIPALVVPFAEWLSSADDADLAKWSIRRDSISSKAIYPRLALGAYFLGQYQALVVRLKDAGIEIEERLKTTVADVRDPAGSPRVTVILDDGERLSFSALVIATGHQWPSADRPADGYFASPWPIGKILPPGGTFYTFNVGILGASLSAFDVVTTLAHYHGEFVDDAEKLTYRLHSGAEGMRLVLHSADGQLPHLLFEQTEPEREIYRHASREQFEALLDGDGFLPLDRFFDEICRPVLINGFTRDGRNDIAGLLESHSFSLLDLVRKLSSEHACDDPFKGMADELAEAEKLTRESRPTHWKEYLDDLFYALNFHAEWLSAEDHLLLKQEILPFVMSVAAAMPLDSARKLLALHDAGVVDLVKGKAEIDSGSSGSGCTRVIVSDDDETRHEEFRVFIDCGGQGLSSPDKHPLPGLLADGVAIPAMARFRIPEKASDLAEPEHLEKSENGCRLRLGGLCYDSRYQLVAPDEKTACAVFDVALPDINGLRPYSYGLQAANEAAGICASSLVGEPIRYGFAEAKDVF